ncbi:MAG: HU family DNA-binding protein [Bacteroidales bacterium]|nr:HU family DNA-binding protein [Bacteroidales bacterium]
MTKAELVKEIAAKTGIEANAVSAVVESLMETIKDNMAAGNEVFLRGFGSFTLKKRAEKTARNITKNTTIIVPAHNIPFFKPCPDLKEAVAKTNVE